MATRRSQRRRPQEKAPLAAENGVPEGWVLSALPEIVEINPPKPAATEVAPDAPVTFVPMGAVDERAGTIARPEVRPFSTVRKGYTAFTDGDVIMAKITPCMENGKAAIARDLVNGLGFGSTEFHVFRSHGAVLPEYVYHYLRQESFRHIAEDEMTGSVGQKRVPRGFLESARLPVPPLAEQMRIVALLEQLLAKLDSCRDRLERIPGLLSRFRQAVLAAAYSGRLCPPADRMGTTDWSAATVNDVCSDIVDCPHSTPKWTPSGEVCLRTTNFGQRGLDLTEVRFVSVATYQERTSRLEPRAGDVVYSREGGILGIACIMPTKLRACLGQRMMLLRCNTTLIRPVFLSLVLNSPQTRTAVRELVGGTASPHVNVGDVRRISVPLPSIAEQESILQRVAVLDALVESISRRMSAALRRPDMISRLVTERAFRGELVPTEAELAAKEGRNFESADELLRRLGIRGLPYG